MNTNIIDNFTTIQDTGVLSSSFLFLLSESFFGRGRYGNVLQEEKKYGGKKMYHYGNHILLFEYQSKEEQGQDMVEWKKKFKKKNALTSETIDGRQILEPSGCFEFQGKYYLLGYLYQDSNTLDNHEEKGVYNGVIVNHERYFQVENQVKNVQQNIQDTIS